MQELDIWRLLAGLGIFLFGMFTLEESVRHLAGPSFKQMIRRYTGGRIRGLLTGIISTSILQSSSAVSLMVLAFVGAGLLTLANAVSVMIGSNIGTTVTAWVVAFFGFKIKIDAFALPLIGIGGLGMIFLSRFPKYSHASRLLVALGFLFHGLDLMKGSVEGIASSVDMAELREYGLWLYFLLGIGLTALMQSSSATIALVLTALNSELLLFHQGAAMVIGANVGTTITILLGAIGGTTAKKQAALSHLAFNSISAVLAFLLLPVLTFLILEVIGLSRNGVLGIALFHTLFNSIGAAATLPFLRNFTAVLMRIYPESKTLLSRFIQNTSPDVKEAAFIAFRNEVLNQLFLSVFYIGHKYSIRESEDGLEEQYPSHLVTYGGLGELHAEIFSFYSSIDPDRNEKESIQMDAILRASRSIMNSTRNLRELLSEVQELEQEDRDLLRGYSLDFKQRIQRLREVTSDVYRNFDRANLIEDLDEFFHEVEKDDRDFIQSMSRSVRSNELTEEEVTRLLMINRLFTQSLRMLVLSAKGLVQSHPASEVVPGPAEIES